MNAPHEIQFKNLGSMRFYFYDFIYNQFILTYFPALLREERFVDRSFLVFEHYASSFSSSYTLGIILIYRTTLRSEEHTSELQSRFDLVCRLLLEKKKNILYII